MSAMSNINAAAMLSRPGNRTPAAGPPARSLLEKAIASLEEADAAFACNTGRAAFGTVMSLFRPGEGLIAPDDLQADTRLLFEYYRKQYGIPVDYLPFGKTEEVECAVTDTTKAIYLESLPRPFSEETDIEGYARIAKRHSLLLIVDHTLSTPTTRKPIALGADIVIHSETHYLAGNHDVQAGLIAAKGEALCKNLAAHHYAAGATLSASESKQIFRGLQTLPLRMKQHEENARKSRLSGI
jgi:cystathionine gamma-synthase